jgi:hypothetical protein
MSILIDVLFLLYVGGMSGWCGYLLGKMRAMNLWEQKQIAEFYKEYKEMPAEQKKAFMEWYIDVKNREAGNE